ncbi:MAG TPA: hypothetical protein VJZ93_03900 [Candidatus Nanoarchaeia archaeon]|nr:hypothetical protein [Candidatus Nanoarchaeia archaeon]
MKNDETTLEEFVPDRFSGMSLGLEYKYRLLEIGGAYVIFDYTNGKIMERIPEERNRFFTERRGVKRLHEINGLKKEIGEEMARVLDNVP